MPEEAGEVSVTSSAQNRDSACLRPPLKGVFTQQVTRWWEWLGRIVWTLLALGAAFLVILALGFHWYVPSTVTDWHDQVVQRFQIVLGIAAGVSVTTGVLFWRRYPSLLRRWGIGWGTD